MLDAELLEQIHGTAWIAELLALFDFDVEGIANGPVEPVHLSGGEALEQVGRDASGGAFMLVGPPADVRPVLYIGSEGEAGRIASNLSDALALIVGLPSLHDATCYDYGDPRLADWVMSCHNEIREDQPSLDEDRARIRAALGLPEVGPLLEPFYAGLRDERYLPIGTKHGERYRCLLD